jgi:hypothetical protein
LNVYHKTSNPLIKSYNFYKENLKDLYQIYMKDPHYKSFINILTKSLQKKKNNFRFLSTNKIPLDLNSIFDESEREKIKKNFENTISSKDFAEEMQKEYKEYKHLQEPQVKKLNQEVDNFYLESGKELDNDPKVKDVTTRFVHSVQNYITNHKKEYNSPGIITLNGEIETNPADYISKEEKFLKENYKEESYTLDDIDKLMQIEKVLK